MLPLAMILAASGVPYALILAAVAAAYLWWVSQQKPGANGVAAADGSAPQFPRPPAPPAPPLPPAVAAAVAAAAAAQAQAEPPRRDAREPIDQILAVRDWLADRGRLTDGTKAAVDQLTLELVHGSEKPAPPPEASR